MIKWKAWPCYKCCTTNRQLRCKGCGRMVIEKDRVAENAGDLQPFHNGSKSE